MLGKKDLALKLQAWGDGHPSSVVLRLILPVWSFLRGGVITSLLWTE